MEDEFRKIYVHRMDGFCGVHIAFMGNSPNGSLRFVWNRIHSSFVLEFFHIFLYAIRWNGIQDCERKSFQQTNKNRINWFGKFEWRCFSELMSIQNSFFMHLNRRCKIERFLEKNNAPSHRFMDIYR